MTTIRETLRRMISRPEPLPAGTYPFQSLPDEPNPYRLHLRIEPGGTGILIVNASTVLHLNHTAVEYAYQLVKAAPPEEAARQIASRYRISRKQALTDYQDFCDKILAMISTTDLDPESFLGFDRVSPYSARSHAPYRLDCALTYRLAPGTPQEAAPVERVKRELGTDGWKLILDKAWDAGIPQIIFTGGEPTLRDDLLELLSYCDDKGQVTGLITDGLLLREPAYLDALLRSGLDHLMMIFNPELPEAWQALKAGIDADLFMAVHLTVSPANLPQVDKLMSRLAAEGVKNISLSAADENTREALPGLHDLAGLKGLSLVWDLPVPYSAFHPVAVEIAQTETSPDGAGKAWMYVEPDGDILPAQGIPIVLGNMLTDPWEDIWNKAHPAGVE